ncbi:hypothetical protein FIBSPDRAFT_935717 [Athelia psychrophila]|uniref:Uncharacterized protein n=1 Tax=Athelia psychrophila TaxID=1759441 RepID=A0A166DAN0_9AGAM|nr:hypothetical protein FIBSPDRAFT_935717 [Fibularhizoctonia sp. CBS 109695]
MFLRAGNVCGGIFARRNALIAAWQSNKETGDWKIDADGGRWHSLECSACKKRRVSGHPTMLSRPAIPNGPLRLPAGQNLRSKFQHIIGVHGIHENEDRGIHSHQKKIQRSLARNDKGKQGRPPGAGAVRTFVNWKVREKKSGEKSGSPGNCPAAGFGRVRQSGGRVEAGRGPDPRSTADQTGASPPQLVSTQSLPPTYGKGKNRYKE